MEKLHHAFNGDEAHAPHVRIGPHANEVDDDNTLSPGAPAGRKLSVLGVEVVDRGQWSGPLDFLMSMVAYAVGLGESFNLDFRNLFSCPSVTH